MSAPSSPAPSAARLARVAARLGLTEGQAYTVALLTLVAVLLSASLSGLTGRIDDALADPAPTPTTTVPTTTTSATTPPPSRSPGGALAPVPIPATTTPTSPSTVDPGPPIEEPEEEPPAPPCAADPLIEIVGNVVRSIDVLTNDVLPSGTVVSALAIATGCSRTDPSILLLAGLIEIGQGLPDLGLGALELPPLPFLSIPQPILDLVQPLRAVLDPVCGTIASLTVITSQVGPSYPAPIDALFALSLFYALTTCGQIQGS